jgi:hypothetical protein
VLYSVSATPDGTWAGGAYNKDGHDVPFVANWDGSEWRESPAPEFGTQADTLWAIDVHQGVGWAVGASIHDNLGNNSPIALRLDDPCGK